MKYFMLFKFSLIYAMILCVNSIYQEWGEYKIHDKLVETRGVILTAHPKTPRLEIIKFPNNGEYVGTISKIVARDLKENPERTLSIVNGGPGFKHVTIKLYIPRNNVIQYEIDVWANDSEPEDVLD